ncbi:hypothetical protein [Rurimicrobium arvi]|uniref:Uncharacterized protein n=1 Tax=Rurimicrobium arvi TaxID=2049916 RepID=A0ABP8MH09_9BACT
MRKILLLLLTALMGCTLQSTAATDKVFTDLIARMRLLESYSYDMELTTFVEDTAVRPEIRHMRAYTSVQDFVRWISGDSMLQFTCAYGNFSVDSSARRVYYHEFSGAKMSGQQLQTYREQTRAYADSLFSDKLIITKKQQQKGITTYYCKYPPGGQMLSLELSVSSNSAMAERLSCVLRVPINPGFSVSDMLQRITLSHYSRKVPAEVTALLNECVHLEQYLKNAYSSFELIKN